jgi:hypothetical protein
MSKFPLRLLERSGIVQRVNVNQFYIMGHVLHPIGEIKAGVKVKDHYYDLYSAQIWLEFLVNDKLVPMGVSRPACWDLLTDIRALLNAGDSGSPNMEKEIDAGEAYNLNHKVETLETVLAAHLQSLNTYFVSRKLGYETPLLIEEAEKLLPENVRGEVPEAIPDIQQAGKCIAFEIPTAAGFHIVRATEAVIRKYYAAAVGKPPKSKMRNWGTYIKNLTKAGADPRVTGFLDHIREAYRNPVFHPEETLTPEDAQVLLGVCISAIVLMVGAMKALKPKSSSAAAG